jgi:two-component system, chemotaxis family, protein-glutamate methylesterase/glutaminase
MIRVLIVDDSAVVRRVLRDELSKYDDIEVVGDAIDPYVARDKIVRLHPDVVTLDVEMPRMDGLSFLAKLMKHHPTPVVIVSSLTPEHSEMALRALELGAIEVVPKPGSTYSTPDVPKVLLRAIRAAAAATNLKRPNVEAAVESAPSVLNIETTHKILAIGASTGGTTAIETVLRSLPGNCPGTVITQHMPEHFTSSFAARLNGVSLMEVREARDGDPVVPGMALLAPGNSHMLVQRSGARYYARIKDGPVVHHQRPSVDVLFQSVAKAAGANAVGVLLTGMGADGAAGLLSMHEARAHTIAQDEATCVVYGMPREAVRLGAVDEIVPLPHVAQRALRSLAAADEAA